MKKIIGLFVIFAIALSIAVVPGLAKPNDRSVPTPNLVEVAVSVNSEGMYAGSFDTLIAAVLAADPAVVQTLTSNGQHTVFAPTDDAFAALGLNETNIGDLDQAALTNILLYHVANGKRMAEDVVSSDQIRMLNKDFVMQEAGVLTDNNQRDSTIIVTDVEAANGVIHVIDTVLLP